MTPENSAQHLHYPSFGVIDASSMISICLRRPDSTPRAYNIFRQLLADCDAGIRPQPDAEIFGRVLEGLVVMSESPGSSDDRRWRARTVRLVQRWESYRGIKDAGKGQAALDAEGIKVYRGWFMGYVR
jgi:DNA-directed RNA polymerase